MSGRIEVRNSSEGDLVIDNVLSTQSELGPSIPDGGYGWIVFLITLFFQLFVPSLLVSFGILIAFTSIKSEGVDSGTLKLWDHKIVNAPLFFIASWTLWEPLSRQFISHSKWPKLFATAGTCLICAGLLFLWMGMTGDNETCYFILSGVLSGLGASIQMAQCHILLAQYFRLKLPFLIHLSHATSAFGFILAPIVLGHHLLINTETQVILWYQAIILQGIILNLFLRKPLYLKSKSNVSSYDYVTTHPDDEEDIFSKNSRELQITVHSQHGTELRTHELSVTQPNELNADNHEESSEMSTVENKTPGNWEAFEDDGDEETTKYQRVKRWEGINDETPHSTGSFEGKQPKHWETFEDDDAAAARNNKSLQLEMSFQDVREPSARPPPETVMEVPTPLFADTLVNNNTNYSYDVAGERQDSPRSSVFVPISANSDTNHAIIAGIRSASQLLQEPTFYKSFITVMTTKWSLFVFFALYPRFLFQEVKEIRLSHLANLVGTISLATLLFSAAAYWINIEKKWRPKTIWFLTWIGALGYFMVSDYVTEGLLIFGAVQIVLSIAALEHVGTPLLCLTVKGEATKEFTLISLMLGMTFLLFLFIDATLKQIFRFMALLNFLTGCLWLANYVYKRLCK